MKLSRAFLFELLMIAILALLVLFIISPPVFASGTTTANLTWVAPTQYTDGTALANGDIASYVVSWAPASGQTGPSGSVTVAGTLTATTVPVPCGGTTFTVAAVTSATAKYPSVTSSPSNAVPYASGVTCGSNPPTGLTAK